MKRILLMRECCIGDVLMTTPLVEEISRLIPGSEIDYMTGPWSAPVLEHNPYIREKISFLRIWGDKKKYKRSLREKIELYKYLKNRKYDIVFVLDVGFQFIFLAWALGIPIRAGFDVEGRGKLLTHKVKRTWRSRVHEIDFYLNLLEKLGYKPMRPSTKIFLTDREKSEAAFFWNVRNVYKKKKIIAIAPGGGVNPGTRHLNKRWSANRFRAVAERLTRENFHIFLIGGPGDGRVINEIKKGLPGENVTCSTGNVSLRDSAARLSFAELLLTNDSGLMHIATATGVPTVSIFGPTNPEILKPPGEQHTAVYHKISCSPCYRQVIGDYIICHTPACMNKISVDEVMDTIKKIFSKNLSAG